MSKAAGKASGRRADTASRPAERPERLDSDRVGGDRPTATASQADVDMMALIAGVAPAKAPRRSVEDSAGLLDRLLASWQILPTLPAAVLDQELPRIMAEPDYLRLRRAYLAVIAFEKAQIAGCRGFLNALRQAGIRHSLLKGAASACFLYPERWMRAAWDFDVGVAWADLETAERLALASGFHQAQRDPDIPRFYRADRQLRAIVEENHFELGFLVRSLQPTNLDDDTRAAISAEPWTHQFWHDASSAAPWCYAVVDIHHKLSLDIELDDLLASAREVLCAGELVSVPDLAWSTAHLIYKLYWEGVHRYGKGLYQYADLVRLIPLLDEATFARTVAILDRYQLVAGGYYSLKHFADFGVALPDFVTDFLDAAARPPQDADAIDINDLGDVWPKLWGRR
jgi:hypothetical protein